MKARRLFRELLALDPEVSREDYCNKSGVWDVAGLEEDLDNVKLEAYLDSPVREKNSPQKIKNP